ncbi:MAG: aldo/keto reductase [Halobacteriaceae archaeon]
MEYTTLGQTGLEVSKICLGCMSFGSSESREWILESEKSKEIINLALDLGINFFDTANVYSHGESERIVGEALDGHENETVLATKVYGQMDEDNPFSGGLSRKTIEQELSASLDRLNRETIDLYQIHRWDNNTPIETTLRTLTDEIRRGRIRYIGASSMWAHQFAEALYTSEKRNLASFVTMQNHYNLMYREEEREMLPLCQKKNIAVIPWSPLARGYLARPIDEIGDTTRGEEERDADRHPYLENGGREINERVQEIAENRELSMAQVSLAWLLHKDWVDAPIVGTTSKQHLRDAVEAVSISLSDSDIEYLEEPYKPVPISGHQ